LASTLQSDTGPRRSGRPWPSFHIPELLVAVYTDLLWHQKSFKPSLSLGLEVQTDISLIGIRTLPVTVYGGWDQSVNTFVWGFFFNVIF
jgi:hypothetical protein